MSGHNTPYHLYQGPLSQSTQLGTTGSIAIDRNPCYVPVDTTAGAAALTLSRPTKNGIFATVCLEVDGGDLTLTVTGGYNAAGDTSIVFGDASDNVVFYSVRVGGVYYWRVAASKGTDVKTDATSPGDAVAAEHGAGAIGTSSFGAPRTYRYTQYGHIITEIHVDITGLGCKGDAQGDVIGLAAGGVAYIGRYVPATMGIVYWIQMYCLETPGEGTATITDDIDIMSDALGTLEYDGAATETVLAKADWVGGNKTNSNQPADAGLAANHYLYLGEGDTGATTGVYNAGQFIIKLLGHPLLT